jgi:hypothetical protein
VRYPVNEGLFDYGIFSPKCRRADLADMKQLKIKLAGP